MIRTKSQFSRNVYVIHDRIWCNKHLRHKTTEKYDNNGKGWYYRFDDDNNMLVKGAIGKCPANSGTAFLHCHRIAGDCFDIKMPSYQYRDSHYKIRWPWDHHNGNPCTWINSLYNEWGPGFSSTHHHLKLHISHRQLDCFCQAILLCEKRAQLNPVAIHKNHCQNNLSLIVICYS